MAKPRVYRRDALCPKCGSNWVKKDGHLRGKQIYKCNQCDRKHQEGAKHRFTDEQKDQAVKMRAGGNEPIGDSPRSRRERNHSKRVGQKKGRWRESV